VRRYREAPDAVRAAALAALAAVAALGKSQQDFTGANIGLHVTGDVTAPFTIDMGLARAPKEPSRQIDCLVRGCC